MAAVLSNVAKGYKTVGKFAALLGKRTAKAVNSTVKVIYRTFLCLCLCLRFSFFVCNIGSGISPITSPRTCWPSPILQ